MDNHKILGVAPGAPPEVIKAAFRALMKVHHPDVGGNPERAREIETAYRQLVQAATRGQASPVPRSQASDLPVQPIRIRGKYLDLALQRLSVNQILSCPPDCTFYKRVCRHRQLFDSLQGSPSLHATVLELRIHNLHDFPQTIDCRNGRAVLIDQAGEFYHCIQVCHTHHSQRFKDAYFEMFSHTQAVTALWFPHFPPGRHVNRFVYKHRVLARSEQGEFWDEELFDLTVTMDQVRFLSK